MDLIIRVTGVFPALDEHSDTAAMQKWEFKDGERGKKDEVAMWALVVVPRVPVWLMWHEDCGLEAPIL